MTNSSFRLWFLF